MDPAGIRQPTLQMVVEGTAKTTIVAAKTLTVTVNGTDIVVRAARDLTVAVGDVVLMVRNQRNQLVAIAREYAAAPAADTTSDTPPPPKPSIVYGSTNITPVETRSYRTSFGWRDDNDSVYQGAYGGWGAHTGCAFYGTKPRSLKGVTVDSAFIRAKRLSGGVFGSQATTLRRITQSKRPGGAPSLVAGSASGPALRVGGSDTHITIPKSYAQDLVDGTAGGLAIDSGSSPYVRLAGRSDWSQAWILTVRWHK